MYSLTKNLLRTAALGALALSLPACGDLPADQFVDFDDDASFRSSSAGDSGGINLNTHEVDLSSVLAESVAVVRSAAEHNEIEVTTEVFDSPNIIGDRSQLVSAVSNLLSNAIKYTPSGGAVSARLVSHGTDVAIVVEDDGIGIPQKDLNRVFERFYRVDRGRGSTTGGTGLGLSIVRNVAVNHGGRVEVTSQEGVGSTFSMVLPVGGSKRREIDEVVLLDHLDE